MLFGRSLGAFSGFQSNGYWGVLEMKSFNLSTKFKGLPSDFKLLYARISALSTQDLSQVS